MLAALPLRAPSLQAENCVFGVNFCNILQNTCVLSLIFLVLYCLEIEGLVISQCGVLSRAVHCSTPCCCTVPKRSPIRHGKTTRREGVVHGSRVPQQKDTTTVVLQSWWCCSCFVDLKWEWSPLVSVAFRMPFVKFSMRLSLELRCFMQ